MSILLFVAALIALDIAALLWGVDSRESPNSPEWARRLAWAQRHGSGTSQPLPEDTIPPGDALSAPSVCVEVGVAARRPTASRPLPSGAAPRPAPAPAEGRA